MRPFRIVSTRALSVVTLTLAVAMMGQTPTFATPIAALTVARMPSTGGVGIGGIPTTSGLTTAGRTVEAEVLRLVNQARGTARKCGSTRYRATSPLRWDARLARIAAAHSQDMAENAYFSHNSRDGRSPFKRMKQAGYAYDSAGENIAAGFRSPGSVVRAWLKSPGHCKNLMRRGYTELGVGYATGGVYGTYWTQDFGNPR